MKKRIFTSIDLPAPAKEALKNVARRDIYWIKWMKPDNFHITLNFLGDLGESEIETVKQVAQAVAGAYQPFALRLADFHGQEDMLWLSPAKSETLEKLQWELKTELKKAGVGKRERRSYAPHILVAKSKTGRHMSWLPKNFQPIEFTAGQINVYESELTPGAATHRLIESFALTNVKN